MPDHTIRLDRTKPYGENRGDLTPDDPLYRVAFWQGGKMGGKHINLPFDSHGNLVPDTGNDDEVMGLNSEGKPTKYKPLWDANMRAFFAAKTKRIAQLASASPDPTALDEDEPNELDGDATNPADDVDFVGWLRGTSRYQARIVRDAAMRRFHRRYVSLVPELIVDLMRNYDDLADNAQGPSIMPDEELSEQFRAALKRHDEALKNAA